MSWRASFCCFLVGTAVAVLGAEGGFGPYNDTKGEGKALVQEVLARSPAENADILGLLKIRPPEGAIVEVPIKMTVRVAASGWQDTYQTQPVLNRLGEVLVINHHPGQTNEYLYGKYSDASVPPKMQRLDAASLYQSLAGSDFFLGDLGLEFLHWPSQKIVKKEMRKSRSCRVVESINPDKTGIYGRVLSWLDFETGNIIRAEGYDRQNRLLKEFSIRKISRSEGKVQVKEMEITNAETDSRTRLEFNLEMPDQDAGAK